MTLLFPISGITSESGLNFPFRPADCDIADLDHASIRFVASCHQPEVRNRSQHFTLAQHPINDLTDPALCGTQGERSSNPFHRNILRQYQIGHLASDRLAGSADDNNPYGPSLLRENPTFLGMDEQFGNGSRRGVWRFPGVLRLLTVTSILLIAERRHGINPGSAAGRDVAFQ
jgi:hypothetical protein